MAETHGFLRVLPDSTGKRLPMTVLVEMTYDNGTVDFVYGDVVVGVTSGMTGTILRVEGNTSSGELHILIPDPVPVAPAFIVGENLQVNGSTRAKAAHVGYPFYFQQNSLSGGNDPTNLLNIDKGGAAYVRFPEGSNQYDAYGKLQVSQQFIDAEYTHQHYFDTDRMSASIVGTGAVSHIPLSGGLLLSVGTDNGALSEVVSHQYHPFRKGQSKLVEFTVAVGDAGKANVKRKWGYGDDNDGLYFCQVGTTFNVQQKSSVSGTVVSTYIPQSEWNGDRLDGTNSVFNKSGILLDLTKVILYWIDIQYPGGTVRFGCDIEGERILCHSFHHFGIITAPYMRTATLPIYFEAVNEGASASTSEMRVWSTVVKTEGAPDTISHKNFAYRATTYNLNSSSTVPIFSIRSKQYINSIVNHKSSYPRSLSILSVSAPAVIEIIKNPTTLTTPTWAMTDGIKSGLEFDEAATVIAGGDKIFSTIIDTIGVQYIDLKDIFNSRDDAVRRHFNDANSEMYTITATRISGGASDLVITLNWDDV